MKKTIIAALIGATSVSGCMTVGNDGHSYVGNHVAGTERDSAVRAACTFDDTVIAGVVTGGLALLFGANADEALAIGGAAAIAQNAISQQSCSRAQAAYANATRNPGVKYSWTGNNGNRGDIVISSNGWATETGTLDGKPYHNSFRVPSGGLSNGWS